MNTKTTITSVVVMLMVIAIVSHFDLWKYWLLFIAPTFYFLLVIFAYIPEPKHRKTIVCSNCGKSAKMKFTEIRVSAGLYDTENCIGFECSCPNCKKKIILSPTEFTQ